MRSRGPSEKTICLLAQSSMDLPLAGTTTGSTETHAALATACAKIDGCTISNRVENATATNDNQQQQLQESSPFSSGKVLASKKK